MRRPVTGLRATRLRRVREEDPSLNGIYTVRTSDGGGLRRLTSDTIEDEPGDYLARRQAPGLLPHPARGLRHDPPDFGLAGLFVLKVNGTGTRKIAPCCTCGGVVVAQGQRDRLLAAGHRASEGPQHDLGRPQRRQRAAPDPDPASCCGGPIDDPDARGCADPVWSPDGTKILFRLTTPGFGEGGDLYTVNADGTGLTQVTHDGDVEFPDWGTHPLATD